MRMIYSLLLYALLPFILLRLWYRSIKNPAYRQRVFERFGVYKHKPQAGGIWVHAVSVGEAIAAIKLIKALRSLHPELAFTVSCGTPTGSEIIQKQLGSSVYHIYAPYDLPGSVRRFLEKCQPEIGIIMETEIWPNLLHQASARGVKLLISNMRLSETSFRRYRKFPNLISAALSRVDQIAAQTENDAKRAIALGADASRVEVVGNLKFDVEERVLTQALNLHELLNSLVCIWLAGSTHEGEDEIVLNVHAELSRDSASRLLILAPRHPERFEQVYQMCCRRFRTQKRSELAGREPLKGDTQVLLLDSIGELSQFIAISDWAFIGGSLIPVGGHNVLEACQAGVPVIFGEYMSNFTQIAQIVRDENAGIQVSDQAELLQACRRLSQAPDTRAVMGANGLAMVQENQGASERTLRLIAPWLST